MRVITGTAKGRPLADLPGLDTRPTASRVKEGLFSAIQFDIEGRRVLDLFAGTGQLGIETLSRGAVFCDFVDNSPAALKVTQRNVQACGLEGRAAFYRRDFAAFLSRARERYGIIFLDPPYASGDLGRALELITAIDSVMGNGIIVCESPAEHTLPILPDAFEMGGEYRYGRTKVTLYRRRA